MSKVCIGVPTTEFARRADFYDHLDLMEKPTGTLVTRVHGQSPAQNRNLIIDEAIKNDCTHILFIDDDVIVTPKLLINLLAHDKDIVSGLYVMRNFPHQPIAFDVVNEKGMCGHYYPPDEETGLIEIVAAGLGACLIKTSVFDKLEKPYIRLGELQLDGWCDDLGFFRRVRQAGFKLYLDLKSPVGHIASVALWPNRIDGKWVTTYDTLGKDQVHIRVVNPRTVMREEKHVQQKVS